MGRPPKPPEERLVTLSVRVPRASVELLSRIVEGEAAFLRKRGLPEKSVHKSSAFRAIWELGEEEYLLQRATLWVTRRNNRYTVEQAAQLLGWDVDTLRKILRKRGVELPDPGGGPTASPPSA